MIYSVFDIESDGLLDTVTKIHCLCYRQYNSDILVKEEAITSYSEMQHFITTTKVLVGHNIVKYDIPALIKILGISREDIKGFVVDTLGLSQYLYPLRERHGLEQWGEEFGIPKPVIKDWSGLTIEEYIHRCKEDVKINSKLWQIQYEYLLKIYGDSTKTKRFVEYITFKLDCIREQEEEKIRLDVEKCKENLLKLKNLYEEKREILSKIMPPHITYKYKSKPKVVYKKDGTLTSHGEKWINLLKEKGLPDYHIGDIKVISKKEPGNPNSHSQIKEWLFSLGWVPTTFNYVRDKTAPYDSPARKIPQISNDDRTDLCDSVKALYTLAPELEELEGYFKINHRIGILTAFLEEQKDGYLVSDINGFTNTLRVQHKKPIVNLPANPKLYWEMIRGVLVAKNDNYLLCGADMSGLEDNTGRHYMYFYDPNYVKELNTPGYDAHLDIAVRAGLMSKENAARYKELDHKEHLTKEEHEEYSALKAIRSTAKKGNFAAKYGAGGAKIAITIGKTEKEGKLLHTAYWNRNWAIKQVAEKTVHKTVNGQMWLYNPVSHFWYSLRYLKDKFSTLNQSKLLALNKFA